MDKIEIVNDNFKDGLILSVGNKVDDCEKSIKLLKKQNLNYGLINIRKIKPLPIDQLKLIINSHNHIVTVEEAILDGEIDNSYEAGIKFLNILKKLQRLKHIRLHLNI